MSETQGPSLETDAVEDHDLIGCVKRDPENPDQFTRESIALLDEWEEQWRAKMEGEYAPKAPPLREEIAHRLRRVKIFKKNSLIGEALEEMEEVIQYAGELNKSKTEPDLENELVSRLRDLAEELKQKMLERGDTPGTWLEQLCHFQPLSQTAKE